VLPWWGWVLLWGVLVVGGGLWVAWRARATWRSARALTAEVARAGQLVTQLEAATDSLREDLGEVTAVTQDPHRVREEYRVQRAESAAARRARRADRRPPWARVH
jgi:hypothetical protein